VRRESAAYLSIPLIYLAFMLAGVFRFVPEYVAINFFLVLFVLMQLRSGRIAASIAERASRPRKARASPLPPAVAEADKSFLVQVNGQAVADIASFLVFLAAIDLSLRASLAATSGGTALGAGALVALGIYFAGHHAARSVAWRAFAERHDDLWKDPAGFDGGKAVRSTGQYFDWRLSIEQGG
jgi:hypothetical protein